jgi:hypothetical protein
MPRKHCSGTRASIDTAKHPASTSTPDSPSGELTFGQLRRWAELIADGRDEFPSGLRSDDHEVLRVEVRQLLRDRMVRLIARCVALQLHREAGAVTEDNFHA